MTTKLQMTRQLIPALLLMLGLMIQTSTVHAQSRGRTSGRKPNTESTEKKVETSSQKKESPKGSSRSSSRQRAAEPSSKGSSQATRQKSGRSSANSNARTSTSRQRSSESTRSGSAQSGRQQSSSGSSKNTKGRSSAGNSRQQNSGRSTASSGDRSSSGSRAKSRSRSSNDSSANGSRQQNAGRSSADRSTRENSGTRSASNTREQSSGRSASSGRTSTTNQRTRAVNNGSRQSSSRGAVKDRGATRKGTVQVDGRRNSTRRDATGVRILPAPNYGWRDTKKHYAYKNRHWRYQNNNVYVNPVYHHRPYVQVNVVWPWQNRYRRDWRPSYRYCQVVYVETGWRGQRHRAKVDIRTNYHHEVRYADHRKAVVDIYLDEIEVYEDGYFLGKVRRFPRDLEHIEATIYRNGEVVYDRDVFIVGDPYVGFEMISTRSYDGYVQDYYNRSHGMEVGRLNFRRKRVDSRRYSQLFDPYDYNGYAPISVLPDDDQLLDYGYDAISYHHYDDNYDPYYGGSYDDSYYDYDNNGNYSVYNAPRKSTHGTPSVYGRDQLSNTGFVTQAQPLTLNRTHEYKTKQGVAVKLQREATLERLK